MPTSQDHPLLFLSIHGRMKKIKRKELSKLNTNALMGTLVWEIHEIFLADRDWVAVKCFLRFQIFEFTQMENYKHVRIERNVRILFQLLQEAEKRRGDMFSRFSVHLIAELQRLHRLESYIQILHQDHEHLDIEKRIRNR